MKFRKRKPKGYCVYFSLSDSQKIPVKITDIKYEALFYVRLERVYACGSPHHHTIKAIGP